ncbi:MAG TPA: hypothetical protein PLI95_26450 [Polyangiaceae bacterium]|nr:hypothetical protein [Polyangiaceae bacterium]
MIRPIRWLHAVAAPLVLLPVLAAHADDTASAPADAVPAQASGSAQPVASPSPHSVASVSAAPSSPSKAPSVVAAPAGSVLVRFEPSEPHVVLERRPDRRRGDQVDSEGSTAICLAGCTVMLDPKATYQVGGTWVSPTMVRLPNDRPGPFLVRARAASTRSEGIGNGMVLSGGILLGLGGGVLAGLLGSGAMKNNEPGGFADHLQTASITMAVTGLVLTLISLPLRSSGVTTVTVDEVSPSPPASPVR